MKADEFGYRYVFTALTGVLKKPRLLNLSLEAVKGVGEDAATAGLTVPIAESRAVWSRS